MASRRIARTVRKKQKRKSRLKLAKKSATAAQQSKPNKAQPRLSRLEQLRKERSALLRRQVQERLALRDHTRDLENRRLRIKRGANAKAERRELGKYIRQLKDEQRTKHAAALQALEGEMERAVQEASANAARQGHTNKEEEEWEDIDSDHDVTNEQELRDMFAHLTV